jgi:hypothetical protein
MPTLNYKNRQLENLPDEVWVDCFGYDGIYSVSNLGRVKSEGRWVNNGRGERWVKERILSQVSSQSRNNALSVSLSVNNIQKVHQVNQLIYYSFYPHEKNDLENNEVAHLNKIQNDNRLCNLKKFKKGESYAISISLGNVTHLDIARRKKHPYTRETGVFVGEELVGRKCLKCNTVKDIKEFEYARNTCIVCRKYQKKEWYAKKKKS